MNKIQSAHKGYANVSLTDRQVILCSLHGDIDSPTVQGSLTKTKEYIQQLRDKNLPARLLIDATAVTGQNGGARTQAKTIGLLGLDKIAVISHNHALGLVIKYLIKAGGMSAYARLFSDKIQANAWLLYDRTEQQQPYTWLRISLGLLVVFIASFGLAGWAIHNDFLKSWIPGLRPMNPTVAIILIVQALSLLIIKKAGTMSAWRKKIVTAIAGISLVFGVLVMLQAAFGINLHADDLLFKNNFAGGLLSGNASPRAAFLLTLISCMQFALLTGQRARWTRYVFHTCSVIVFGVTFLSILGYGFGQTTLYKYTNLLPMPLNTAVCILLINHALQSVARQLPYFEREINKFNKYSQAVLICVAIILTTGIAWRQSNYDQQHSHNTATKEQFSKTQTVIQDRINGYINTLRGYRSFFQSSDFVSALEFQKYFASSRLDKYYPGFTAVTFAQNLSADQRVSYESSIKKQADADFPAYKSFVIFPASSASTLYPTLYVQPSKPTTRYGFDLYTNDTRRQALEKARDSGEITATDTIDLNASRADSSLPKRPGFYITIPIYKTNAPTGVPSSLNERRADIYGFVNAIFEDKILFKDIFNGINQQDTRFTISSAKSGETLYNHNSKNLKSLNDASRIGTITIAGQHWDLALYAPSHFGMHGISQYIPIVILTTGTVVAVMATALSVSQVRRKDQALKLAATMTEDLNNERDIAVTIQQKDEAILSSIGDAVFALNVSGKIILFNQAAANITGVSAQSALGKSYDQIFHFRRDKDRTPADQFIQLALSGKPASMTDGTVLVRKNETSVPVADSAAPIINSKGQVEGAVVVFRDISREKELDRLKNEFVSMASHELRTPMGAIRAMSSMVLAGDYGPVNKNLKEPIQDIHSATLRLVDLVNDLLNVARIEANRMKFNLKDTAPTSILKEVVKNLSPLGKEKHIVVTLSTASRLPHVQADKDKLLQVLTNLVGNSLKFTDKGSITLAATTQKEVVEVTITDTGTGINQSDQQKLFGKFQQISSAQQGRPAGTGLGLYISREIIRRMGGELWIKTSTPGVGTTFAFTLPLSNTQKAQQAKQDRLHDEKLHPDSV